MKPSHLQTPRTLADTTFTSGYQCAPRDTGYGLLWWVVVTIISALGAFVIGVTA